VLAFTYQVQMLNVSKSVKQNLWY